MAVDTILRFENHRTNLSAVCDRIGLPRPAELPHLKIGIRPSAVDYRDPFTTRQAEKIARYATGKLGSSAMRLIYAEPTHSFQCGLSE